MYAGMGMGTVSHGGSFDGRALPGGVVIEWAGWR